AAGRDGLAAWSESRPDFTEAEAVRRVLYLAGESGCPVYLPHVSCAKSLAAVAEHRAGPGTAAYVETCPHYLTHTMGSDVGLEVGADADLTVVDPDLTRRVTPGMLRSRSDFSLYEGRELAGWPVLTMLRGQVVMRDGEVIAEPGFGRYVRRS